jgi:hypothetical protein
MFQITVLLEKRMILDFLPLTYKQISFFQHKEIKDKVVSALKLQAMKVYGVVEIKCHTFLTVTLDEGEGSPSCVSIEIT